MNLTIALTTTITNNRKQIELSSMKHWLKQGCLTGIMLITVAACSSIDSREYAVKHANEDVLLAQAKIALEKKQFFEASQYLQALDSRFPFSHQQAWAQKMMVYALYASDQLAQAEMEADAYLATHAFDPDADYIYYLRGLIAFDQNQSWLRRHLGYDASSRDMTSMRLAYDQFTLLTQRFPDSPYANDAKQRLDYIYNLMAKSEWETAQFYYKKHAFHAAINRIEHLLRFYPKSIFVSRAKKLKSNILHQYHLV